MKLNLLMACAALAMASTASVAAPHLMGTLPHTGAVGVPVSVNLVLHYNTPVHPGPGGGWNLWRVGGPMIMISSTNTDQVHYNGQNVTLNPPVPLMHHTWYYLTWPQGTVVDGWGHQEEGNGSDTLLRFRTN